MTAEELAYYEDTACPTCGSCSGLFTANSMNCLCEALGVALPGNGTVPAVYAERIRLAKQAGRKVMELVERDIKIGDIVSAAAIHNAMECDMAFGGSTNTVLHILAMAQSADDGRLGCGERAHPASGETAAEWAAAAVRSLPGWWCAGGDARARTVGTARYERAHLHGPDARVHRGVHESG